MKFHDKLVSLRQLNSPNKFKICCIDMYFLRFLANFAGFRGFTWISWLRAGAKYQKPCYYELRYLHYVQTGDKKFASGDYISPVSRQKATWGFFCLGVTMWPDLTWYTHINTILEQKQIACLHFCSSIVLCHSLQTIGNYHDPIRRIMYWLPEWKGV